MGNIKETITKLVFEIKPLFQLANWILESRSKTPGGTVVKNNGHARLIKDFSGTGNLVTIEKGCTLLDTKIRIRGNNNSISFGEGCIVGEGCSFWMEGNNIRIEIGKDATFTGTVHVCAQEDGSRVVIGEDCMFSYNITVRTSDSHPVYDVETGVRVNPAKDVAIGKHVWIAPDSKIMKGVTIGDESIIGSDTIVTKDIPAKVLAVGHPAKVVRENVRWTRESLY